MEGVDHRNVSDELTYSVNTRRIEQPSGIFLCFSDKLAIITESEVRMRRLIPYVVFGLTLFALGLLVLIPLLSCQPTHPSVPARFV